MNKYAFNHDGKTTFEAIGISDERMDCLVETLTSVAMRAIFTDKSIDSISKALEVLINETQPSTFEEAMAIGYHYALAHQRAANAAKIISSEIKP